jgi:hypothetical protein
MKDIHSCIQSQIRGQLAMVRTLGVEPGRPFGLRILSPVLSSFEEEGRSSQHLPLQ